MITRRPHMTPFALAVGAIALVVGFDAPAVQAQSWSYERFERKPGPHRWGNRCMERIETRGTAGVKAFSNKDKRLGKERAVENWSQQVAAEFGPQFANWERARGQELDCRTRKLKVICTASAHPCR